MADDVDGDVLDDEDLPDVPFWRRTAGSVTCGLVGFILGYGVFVVLDYALGGVETSATPAFIAFVATAYVATEVVGYRVADRLWLTPHERRKAREGDPRGFIEAGIERLRSRRAGGEE